MIAEIFITYFLKDGTSNIVSLKADFSSDEERAKMVLDAMKLGKGGYSSLIQVSKIISEKSEGCILINPIHINAVNIRCSFNNDNLTLKKLLEIAGDCDMRRYSNIDWIKIKNER